MLITKMYLKHIEIAKNDILKNEATAICLINVRGENNSASKIIVRNNSITEIFHGYGIHLENCSLTLERNDIRKNNSHALFIQSQVPNGQPQLFSNQ